MCHDNLLMVLRGVSHCFFPVLVVRMMVVIVCVMLIIVFFCIINIVARNYH